ncbi:MAG TPA: hypothetical protein DDW65_23980 [Firmicutes bacterium]|jgi:hypothetical protein|nr:hypothetical protein [Bacillota bacterium]
MVKPKLKDYRDSGLIVSGHSDDLIFVEGDLSAEFYPEKLIQADAKCECLYMAFSDGTLLRFCFDEDGLWRFVVQFQGSLFGEKLVGSLESQLNDVVVFQPGVKWCLLGPTVAKKNSN